MVIPIDAVLIVNSFLFAITIFSLQARMSFLTIPETERINVENYFNFSRLCPIIGLMSLLAIILVLLSFIPIFISLKEKLSIMSYVITSVAIIYVWIVYFKYFIWNNFMDSLSTRNWNH